MTDICHDLRAALRFVKCPTPSAKLVLMAIIDLGDEEYTQATLASHTGFSLRQVGTLLKALEAAELISRARRGGTGKGRLCDRYEVTAKIFPIAAGIADCALPIAHCAQPEISQTPRATTTRQSPPDTHKIPPYDNNSTPLFDNLRSVVGEEGSGEEPACAAPKSKTKSVRGPRLARPATEATMPAAMTPGMRAAADKAGKLNGSGEAEFNRWRDYHLTKADAIADYEASFRTWLANGKQWAADRRGPATTLPDGRVVTYKKHGFVAT